MVAISVRPLSTFSKDFSPETIRPMLIKFHVHPRRKAGKKVYIFGPGDMTKMAAMLIYDNNVRKSLSPDPLDRLT